MKKLTVFLDLCLVLLLMVGSGLPRQTAAASGSPSLPILFGAYTKGDLRNYVSELTKMNNWLTSNGASGVTFAGDFVDITYNTTANVPSQLEAAWEAGFVPFINMMGSQSWEGPDYYDPNCETTGQIASGACDGHLTAFANAFKAWAAQGGGRRAFLAPLPEANGTWGSLQSDGPTFINAFIRIRQKFEQAGVPRSAVRWVFAPNGGSDPQHPERRFENYYPGDNYADEVAFSAYNYGGCTQYPSWDTFEKAMKPYLDRMRVMAPAKPIFIAQTGVLGKAVNPGDPTQTKSYWVQDTFSKLADYPAVRGIIYFNKINIWEPLVNCNNPPDYRIFYADANPPYGEYGFRKIMQDARFGKWATNSPNWSNIAFVDPAYTFADVLPTHPFSGAPNVWYYDYVLTLYNSGVTGGCTTSPLKYCPNDNVSRAQMAVFLERGIHGSGFTPPSVPLTFTDTAGDFARYWIEALKNDGITSGCGPSLYCPAASTTRAEMAIFLLRSKHGASYVPPAASGTLFTDVPSNYWAANWIEQLANEGITSGCGGSNYCPDAPVTRAQMAVFLVRTFNLP